jgi:hypothetical protein
LPIGGGRSNRTWLWLVQRLLSGFHLRLVNGLCAVNRHILHSSRHAACSDNDETGEQDDRCQRRKTSYIVLLHPVGLDSERHEDIQSANQANWKLPPPELPECSDAPSLDAVAIDNAVTPQRAVSDSGRMKCRVSV